MPAYKYMHEGRLLDAFKRLYMLGNDPNSASKSAKDADDQMTATFGSARDAYAEKLARDKAATAKLRAQLEARQKQEAADAQQMDEDVRYIKEGPEGFREWQQVTAGQAVPSSPYKDELAKQAVDRERAQTNVGGVYTPQGLDMAEKEGTANAQDRLLLRSLIQPGLAGTQPIQTPPPDYMRNYRTPQ